MEVIIGIFFFFLFKVTGAGFDFFRNKKQYFFLIWWLIFVVIFYKQLSKSNHKVGVSKNLMQKKSVEKIM